MNAPGAPALPWGEPSHGDSQWHVRWGGRLSDTSVNPGHAMDRHSTRGTFDHRLRLARTEPAYEARGWLATATSLPLAAGIVTFDDWRRRTIDHAVGIALPQHLLTSGQFVWPAQRTDGRGAGPIPQGTRFRLPADYRVDPAAPELVRILAEAAKRHGLIVWDGGTGVGNPHGAAADRGPARPVPGAEVHEPLAAASRAVLRRWHVR